MDGTPKSVYEKIIKTIVNKYWSLFDQDQSGGLNFAEFRHMQYAIAKTSTNLIMSWYDSDKDGALNSTELDDYAEWNFEANGDDMVKCMIEAWKESDRKFLSLSRIEV